MVKSYLSSAIDSMCAATKTLGPDLDYARFVAVRIIALSTLKAFIRKRSKGAAQTKISSSSQT